MWCLFNYNDAQILNIGTTEELSVKEIACLIANNLNINVSRIEFDTTKPKGIFKKASIIPALSVSQNSNTHPLRSVWKIPSGGL